MPGNDSFTKLLLHFDGTPGSETFTDSSSAAHTVTTAGTDAQSISDAQSKFGGTSCIFGGGWLTSADSDDWDFGTGDFTVDWWEYRASDTNGKCAVARTHTGTFVAFLIGYSEASGTLRVYMSSNGSSWDIASQKSLGSITLNTWSHKAVVRSGNTFYCFKDGVQTDTWTSSAALLNQTAAFSIGSAQQNLGVPAFTGHIDELRVSKGIARWTSGFTPPDAPYDSVEYRPIAGFFDSVVRKPFNPALHKFDFFQPQGFITSVPQQIVSRGQGASALGDLTPGFSSTILDG